MNKGIITFSNDNSGNSNNTRSKVNVIKNNDEQTNLIHNVNIGTTTVGDNNTSDGGTISINKQHPSYNSNESTPTSPTSSTSIPNVNNASSSSPVDMSSSSSSSSSSNMKQQPVTTERSTSVCGKGKGKATDNESPTNRTQAAFVNKLYKMLEDESIQHLINWSENGDLFSVSNPTAFSKLVLPQYFKHNNWQSFVRQLNMYGFHKVNDMIHSNLTSECQKWEFRHQNFRRGAVEELQNIKRKSAKSHHQYLSSSMAASPVSTSSMGRLLLGGNPNQQQQPHQSYQQHSIQHPGGGNPLDNKSNTNTSVDKLHSRTLYHQVIRLEDRMNKITQSHDSLKNETSELWSILSKQQVAMQDITDILVQLTREGNNNIQKDAIESIKRYVNGFTNAGSRGKRSGGDTVMEYSPAKRPSLDIRPTVTLLTSRPSTPPAPPAPPPHKLTAPSYPSNVDINKSNSLTSSPIQYHNNANITSSNSSNGSKASRKSDSIPISSILSASLPPTQKQDDTQQHPSEQKMIKRLPSINAVCKGPYPPPPTTSSTNVSIPSTITDYDRPRPLLPLRSLLHPTDSRSPGMPKSISDIPKDAMLIDSNGEIRTNSPYMGLGKESSILNPPPHLPYDYNSIHETKRRRTDQ